MEDVVKEIRFIARSAHEAVDRVRSELGSDGQVVSVRQVTGSGLQRFLKAPQLEIVARRQAPSPMKEASIKATELSGEPEPQVSVPASVSEKPALTCGKFLGRAGFSPALMARLEGAQAWRDIQELSIAEGLPQAIAWLHDYKASQIRSGLPARIAFLGGPGVGKTTCLCKCLAREVFIKGNQPEVLRLEVDKPHMDSGLSLYCEILGLSCKEDPSEIDFSGEKPVFVDVPGFSLHVEGEKERIRNALDEIGVYDRVMVLNAAYDSAINQRFCRDGSEMGAKYKILTHVDELYDFGKLWQYVLDLEHEVLLFSNGQNVAGDIIEDTFKFLMERTFPK